MIAIFTDPKEVEFIEWVKRAIQLSGFNSIQVEVVPLDKSGYIAMHGYAKIIKEAKASIIDADRMSFHDVLIETSCAGTHLDHELLAIGKNHRNEPWLIDPRLIFVTHKFAGRLRKFFGGLISVISVKGGYTDKVTNALAAWTKTTVEKTVPRVFVSYRSEQLPLAEKIVSSLKRRGAYVWFDKTHIMAGDPILKSIDHGIAWCTHFVLIIDEAYFDSGWTKAEVEAMLHRELSENSCWYIYGLSNHRPVIPIHLIDPGDKRIPPILQRIKGIDGRKEEFTKIMNKLWQAIKKS